MLTQTIRHRGRISQLEDLAELILGQLHNEVLFMPTYKIVSEIRLYIVIVVNDVYNFWNIRKFGPI
jgi:hypothetical protein